MNAPGSGVADDKLVHAHIDELVRLYLAEEPLLPSIPSRPVGPDEELDDLVVKPRGEMGGEGVVIWRDAGEDTRERVREQIAGDPGGWIGQELVTLSVHPTVTGGGLEPRHVDLRPYALLSTGGVRVLPAAISRVAVERGSMIVNSGQGRRRKGHLGARRLLTSIARVRDGPARSLVGRNGILDSFGRHATKLA